MAGKRVASYSEKGGVGKSALAAGLAATARRRAHAGKIGTVYAADLDPRGTLTSELGLDPEALPCSLNDLLAADPKGEKGLAADVLLEASEAWSGIHVLAAERALAHRETDQSTGIEFRLRNGLDGVVTDDDLAVIDLPPRAGGKLVVAGLTAATHVVIPATLDENGRIGAREALDTIRHGSTAERSGSGRTARSRSVSMPPPTPLRARWTGSCTCLGSGRMNRAAAAGPASRTAPSIRRSGGSHSVCWTTCPGGD